MKKIILKLLTLTFIIMASAPSAIAAQTLTVGNTGSSIKPAMIVLAQQMGYYKDEGVDVEIKQISNLNEGIAAVQMGKLDILPLGVIPSMTFIAKGADLVVYGGTIAEGSQGVTLKENKDKYKNVKNFKGKKIAVHRPETGHMIMKAKMREAGLDLNKDVEIIQLDGFQSIIEAVSKGAADIGFVNSGFGLIAEKKGLAVAFNVGSAAPNAVCCRQTTSRQSYTTKFDALVKFQTANLRAYKLLQDDPKTAVKKLMDYSGQPEDYVKYCLYANVMVITMDPAANRVKDFYEIMRKNGDLPKGAKNDISKNIDTKIYRAALDEMLKRHPKEACFKKMDKEFAANNL
ncbi:MAG: ABC transporter substrate-binding protein [Cloacibacillus sp.]